MLQLTGVGFSQIIRLCFLYGLIGDKIYLRTYVQLKKCSFLFVELLDITYCPKSQKSSPQRYVQPSSFLLSHFTLSNLENWIVSDFWRRHQKLKNASKKGQRKYTITGLLNFSKWQSDMIPWVQCTMGKLWILLSWQDFRL